MVGIESFRALPGAVGLAWAHLKRWSGELEQPLERHRISPQPVQAHRPRESSTQFTPRDGTDLCPAGYPAPSLRSRKTGCRELAAAKSISVASDLTVRNERPPRTWRAKSRRIGGRWSSGTSSRATRSR